MPAHWLKPAYNDARRWLAFEQYQAKRLRPCIDPLGGFPGLLVQLDVGNDALRRRLSAAPEEAAPKTVS